ncbi:hypothetical protein N7494_012285 [Penicillium frequentans]|uniref:BHLH domain-containing protein n=1 Tax=Penicillium frequentans TaxID=3151616 RepID=A0AAD6GBK5_9EURO|nr:hypothetical protein N7494_012285 [Penicillium glabrum]
MNGPVPEIQTGRNSPPPGPFGYSFLSPMDTPYEQAPALPPGPSLLDDNESNMLDNFFTTMNANSFTNDFWLRAQHNKTPGLNFDWSDELPPTFEGSTTSLSQPSYQQHALGKPNMMVGNTPGPDIYAAASMLYQGGINGSDIGSALAQQVFATQPLLNGSHINGAHPRHNSQSAPVAHTSVSSPTNSRLPAGYHTSEMLFDVRDPIPADQHPSRKVRSLQWGTDISFMDQGYVAPPDQPDEETRTRELLDHLDCFEPQTSAANTRPPSPERMPGSHAHHSSIHSIDIEDASQPRKRPRMIKEDPLSDEDEMKLPARKSRTMSNAKARRASTNAPRKASIQSNSKNARENLSEEQKRTNHILSEQKRRNLIRQGFDDLCSLVPGLRGGGFSKSAMLTQAADWLEEIMRGNEILQSQLADMKGINGLVMPR